MSNRRRVTKSEDATFKIIMVGKSAVGKSSLLTRYTKDSFQHEYMVTVGTFPRTQAWSSPPRSSRSTRTSTSK